MPRIAAADPAIQTLQADQGNPGDHQHHANPQERIPRPHRPPVGPIPRVAEMDQDEDPERHYENKPQDQWPRNMY
jgi:hypothetical protein